MDFRRVKNKCDEYQGELWLKENTLLPLEVDVAVGQCPAGVLELELSLLYADTGELVEQHAGDQQHVRSAAAPVLLDGRATLRVSVHVLSSERKYKEASPVLLPSPAGSKDKGRLFKLRAVPADATVASAWPKLVLETCAFRVKSRKPRPQQSAKSCARVQESALCAARTSAQPEGSQAQQLPELPTAATGAPHLAGMVEPEQGAHPDDIGQSSVPIGANPEAGSLEDPSVHELRAKLAEQERIIAQLTNECRARSAQLSDAYAVLEAMVLTAGQSAQPGPPLEELLLA
mmetsp:Transcript_2377/g.6187  ORF Transcript_2377/g.6187 Transcript_2377/m.6187 type:complete len:289 (+) Transcript_2377:452-1318(+)